MTARQGLGRGILGSQDLGHGHGAADGGREAGDLGRWGLSSEKPGLGVTGSQARPRGPVALVLWNRGTRAVDLAGLQQ